MEDTAVKRFKSCFISDVDVYSDHIIIFDSRSNPYIIYKNDKNAMESFTQWFKNIYMKCIVQSLVVIDYRTEMKNHDEYVFVVNKLITQHNVNTTDAVHEEEE